MCTHMMHMYTTRTRTHTHTQTDTGIRKDCMYTTRTRTHTHTHTHTLTDRYRNQKGLHVHVLNIQEIFRIQPLGTFVAKLPK